MAGYMNRYRREPSTNVASKFGLAHVGAQLKVENPASLRTIWNLRFIAVPASVLLLQGNAYLSEALIKNLIKNQNSAIPCQWRREHCTQKERPALGEGFIDERQ